MIREEAITVLQKIKPIPCRGDTKSTTHLLQTIALDMAIKALEQEPCWIPVSDRLPEKNTAVLTYISTGLSQTYCLAYWNDVRDGWEEWIGYDLIEKDRGYKVLAWMPLPEPYVLQESEGE